MDSLLPVLEARGTKSLRVTSLLEKRTERSSGYKADYVGFSIPDKFVVGFCLDFNEAFRRATLGYPPPLFFLLRLLPMVRKTNK